MQRKTLVAGLIALFLMASVAASGQSGERAKVKGMITSRSGETLIVKSGGIRLPHIVVKAQQLSTLEASNC